MPGRSHNNYNPDVRTAFNDYVDGLQKDRQITRSLASRVTLGTERRRWNPKVERPTVKEALEHMVAAWCPADGSAFKYEAINDAYVFALLALGVTHDQRMADHKATVVQDDPTNPLECDMR